jgi:hypothetical protein
MKRTVDCGSGGSVGHSHDKTLISRLGFSDPDKKDILHDVACKYLIQHENMVRLVKSFSSRTHVSCKEFDILHRISCTVGEINDLIKKNNELVASILYDEERMNKAVVGGIAYYGKDHYLEKINKQKLNIEENNKSIEELKIERKDKRDSLSTFIQDIMQNKSIDHFDYVKWEIEKPLVGYTIAGFIDVAIFTSRFMVMVEVKIYPVSVNEVIRQIKFYEAHLNKERGDKNIKLVLAHAFVISDVDREILLKSNITPLFLGDKFKQFAKDQENNKSTEGQEGF